ncbi:MAG: YfcE family phosphodiesterase [Planctomycetota bacterium]|nr:YfcE family phosphodiesterase [Planctomycetota bacterium]
MLLGVVSDTHGNVHLTRRAIRMLESLQVEAVLHCGDIGTAEIIHMFEPWQTHFVFGNTDHDQPTLRRAIQQAKLTCHERYGELELAERKIALLHSDDARKFAEVCQSGQFDLVCYGHTHLAKQERVGKTLILNPGAIHRASPHSIAVVDLFEMQATIVPLD